MADQFPNLPGIVVGISDGNLVPLAGAVTPAVLLIGTATKGPSETLTTLSSAGAATRTFGNSYSIPQGAIEAFQGGAPGAQGYRILATSAKVFNIGGGLQIETVNRGSDALDDLSVLFDDATGRLRVYQSSTGTLAYDNDPDSPVDLGLVFVTGAVAVAPALQSLGIGEPVVIAVDGDEGSQKTGTLAAQVGVAGDVPAHHPLQILISESNLLDAAFDATSRPMRMIIEKEFDDVILRYDLEVLRVAATTVGAAAAEHRVVDLVSTANLAAAGNDAGADIETVTYRLYRSDTPAPAASMADNSITRLYVLPGSNLNGLKLKNAGTESVADTSGDINYLAVKTSAGFAELAPTNMNLFEGLIQAQNDLEAEPLDYIVPMGMHLDAPNLGDEGAVLTDFATAGVASVTIEDRRDQIKIDGDLTASGALFASTRSRDSLWIVIDEAQGAVFGQEAGVNITDPLVRVARILSWEVDDADTLLHLDREISTNQGQAVFAVAAPSYKLYDLSASDMLLYYTSDEVDGAIQHKWFDAAGDINGQSYHEVNFAHQLASFCHMMVENDNFALGVVGMLPPSNHFQPAARSVWIGKLPSYDADGTVDVNGTGLLGNKYLAGALEGNVQFSPGFFATSNGYLDDTSVLLDDNEVKVDVGRYLSIVPTWPIFNNLIAVTNAGYAASGAALFAGLQASIKPWESTINRVFPGTGIRLSVKLAKRHKNSLIGLGYTIMGETSEGRVAPVDAPSASLRTSDFTRNMTSRLVGEVLERVRSVGVSFIGEPLTAARRAGLETALQRALADVKLDSDGVLESYQMQLTQTPLEKVQGIAQVSLSLRIVGELRRIFVTLSLSL